MSKKIPAGHAMAVALIESEAPNYYSEILQTSVTRDIEVIARYVDSETPTQQLEKALAKIATLESANRKAYDAGVKAGRTVSYMTAQDSKPIAGEIEQLVVKIKNYQTALSRIAEGMPAPMLLARAVLDGAPGDVA